MKEDEGKDAFAAVVIKPYAHNPPGNITQPLPGNIAEWLMEKQARNNMPESRYRP
jgi:hypothetical protein